MSLLEAVIFDFDGVIVDSEPAHMAGFLAVMAPYGISFTESEYYAKYLSYSDHDAMINMSDEFDLGFDEQDIAKLIAQKSRYVCDAVAAAGPLPGAIELLRSVREAGLGLAICSAALGSEVRAPLKAAGVLDLVQLIIAAEDVKVHKPNPAGYIESRKQLGEILGRELCAARCVAIEDSPGGIRAALGAELKVLAVTNTVDASEISNAHRVVDSLDGISIADLEAIAAM